MPPPPQNPSARFVDRPWAILAALATTQILCWTLSPLLTADAPPLDVVENTIWGTEHILASYKNPALSSLLLEGARIVTGAVGWPAYILSQLCIAVTFVCVFLLGREPMGEARALAGTLLLPACYYFGWHSPEFNHDILEMPFWAATALVLWRAVEHDRPIWWIILGAISAGSLYGKLSAVVMLAAAAGWLLIDARARARLATRGPWIALTVFAVVAAPLAICLANGGLATIKDYAVARGKGHSAIAIKWIALQAGMVVPMAAIAWLCGLFSSPGTANGDAYSSNRFTRFLLWMTIGPILLTAIATVIESTGAKLMWGVPMLNLTGLLLTTLATPGIEEPALRRLTVVSLSLVVVLAAASAADTYFWPRFSKEPARQNWPQAAIADRFRQIWHNETGKPLRIVAGESMNWASGLVALSKGDMPSVFTNASYQRSPWITPERVARDGVLVVWPVKTGNEPPPAELEAIVASNVPRYEEFPLRHPGRAKSVQIGYVIIPPAD